MTDFAALLQLDPLARALLPAMESVQSQFRTAVRDLARRGRDEEAILDELVLMFHDFMPEADYDFSAVKDLAKAVGEGWVPRGGFA
ncbi:hypothetical protein G7072_11185 [Nocardioides sp. HDW12B]|uniref:hypothetical protein n=1 Tax=Nocardioides sp. HDW12B TaxID=2714939 RepID=UPI001409C899|nr:hypothetical protein [Nocardioides sp. HDW12B]QIK66828.1 hypothetical protein G7072_11185 [Nocardioides sp. HDW12B]